MTADRYHRLLNEALQTYTPPYERDNEGLVYVGLPDFRSSIAWDDLHPFTYYLCLFVGLDLKMYELVKSDYERLRSFIGSPKFEYGLTNIFYEPNDIFNRMRIGIQKQVLADCFHKYSEWADHRLEQSQSELSLDQIHAAMTEDEDLQKGLWGRSLMNLILNQN